LFYCSFVVKHAVLRNVSAGSDGVTEKYKWGRVYEKLTFFPGPYYFKSSRRICLRSTWCPPTFSHLHHAT